MEVHDVVIDAPQTQIAILSIRLEPTNDVGCQMTGLNTFRVMRCEPTSETSNSRLKPLERLHLDPPPLRFCEPIEEIGYRYRPVSNAQLLVEQFIIFDIRLPKSVLF
jgi:hypothetical protein